MTKRDMEANETIADLRAILKPGDTVYTVLRGVSTSGMSRNIDLYIMQDNQPRWISRLAARATGFNFNEKKDCIRVGGCGMDMGFHLVYSLSRCMFRDTFTCIGDECPANDHNNAYYNERDGNCVVCGKQISGRVHLRQVGTKRKYKVCSSKCAREPWTHSDGGYALKHRWM